MSIKALSIGWSIVLVASVITALQHNQLAGLRNEASGESITITTPPPLQTNLAGSVVHELERIAIESHATNQRIAQLEAELNNIEQITHPEYESTRARAEQDAKDEFYATFNNFADVMEELERARTTLALRSAEIRVMREFGLVLSHMGMESGRLNELLEQLTVSQQEWAEHRTLSRAGQAQRLTAPQHPAVALRTLLTPTEMEEFSSLQQANTEQRTSTLAEANLLRVAPGLEPATRIRVRDTYAELIRPHSGISTFIQNFEWRLEQIGVIRDQFAREYSGDEWRGISRFLDSQENTARMNIEVALRTQDSN